MAGLVVPVMPMRALDFGYLDFGASHEFVLKRNLDVSEWLTASLVVRVLDYTISGTGSLLKIGAFLEGPTPEDPGVTFLTTSLLAQVQLGLAPAPYVLVTPLLGAMGSHLRVVAQATFGSNPSTLKATLSVDACLRNG